MYVTVFVFSPYLNIMRPTTATADGEAGDNPG